MTEEDFNFLLLVARFNWFFAEYCYYNGTRSSTAVDWLIR